VKLFNICALVASSSAQAAQICERIELRAEAGLYPREIEFRVFSDPDGGRVGSGGAAILAACELRERLLAGDSVLVINAGGESRRMPAYAPEGKLFAPLPLPSSSRIPPVILDEQLGLFLRYPWNEGELVVTSGDVTISFDTDIIPAERGDIYGFAKSDTFELGSHHGVYKFDKNRDKVTDFFQKASVEFLQEQARLEGSHSCALDLGIVGFSPAGLQRLCALSSTLLPTGETFLSLLQEGRVSLDLYVELLMAFLDGISFESYCEKVRPSTTLEPSILKAVHEAFQGIDFRAFLTKRTRFLHFGSLPEYPLSCEELVASGATPLYVAEDFELRPTTTESLVQFNSVDCTCTVVPGARHVYLESCARSHLQSMEGENLIVGLRDRIIKSPVPRGLCLDERSTPEGRFLLAYGNRDTWRPRERPEEVVFCGVRLDMWAQERDLDPAVLSVRRSSAGWLVYDLWDAPLFAPDADTRFTEGYWNPAATDAGWRADFRSARRWSIREIAAAESLADREENRALIRQELLGKAISSGHGWVSISEWDFRRALADADHESLRAICDATEDDLLKIYRRKLVDAIAPRSLKSDSIVSLGVNYLEGGVNIGALRRAVKLDQIVWARSPVRLDLAGGWTDTPPFTLREGGEVVNVAVNLNDQPPIQVFCRPTSELTIRIHSIDLGVGETIRSIGELEIANGPGSPFSLPKAALCLLGFTTKQTSGDTLEKVLSRIGCGLEMTLLSAVPKGSGLGTSSILAATILGALERFFGLEVERDELIRQVLQIEQMLTTGGGWQDQIGGLVGGVKYISTMPGMRPKPMIYQLDPHVFEAPESAARFTLYYTGITRLAKNILQEVVDRANTMDPSYLFTLRHLKRLARAAREAISRRDLDALADVLSASWEENKLIHRSTSNDDVEALLGVVSGRYSGMKLLGAGGGGFILFLSDSADTARSLRERLTSIEDDRARVVDMRINDHGLHVTVS
jgi:galactokinase/mevalonate kinase-like predicted kinase